MAIANPDSHISPWKKAGSLFGLLGLVALLLAAFNTVHTQSKTVLIAALGAIALGVGLYTHGLYKNTHAGIKNNGVWFNPLTARGWLGWLTGVGITSFYIVLYFFAEWLGLGAEGTPNSGLVGLFDPLSEWLSGRPASQWFVYGTLYTLAILIFGFKFMRKYRHNRYQLVRTASVMFFQLAFAFLIPELMARLNGDLPYYDLKNIWPLNYYNFEQYRIDGFIGSGSIGMFMLLFGIASIFVISPVLTYFFGKRWYCSWVCGCGGLAETVGDPFRHLSDKSTSAWRFERWLIHLVLVFSVLMTTAVIYGYLDYDAERYLLHKDVFLLAVGLILLGVYLSVLLWRPKAFGKDARTAGTALTVIIFGLIGLHYLSETSLFILHSESLRSTYGFLIGAVFSGVIGTGFYPIFGSRVWCRFGCPMAAILGFQQRLLSRFRITTNGGQCISCGNCSTYCEMGIDVRYYAQRGENIVRSSCVGCGICSAVCPRGVLKLENKRPANRVDSQSILLGNTLDLTAMARANSDRND